MENNNTTKLTEEQIDEIVKTSEENTPEEVINMRHSIENADDINVSEEGYEEEIKNISLDSSYEDLLAGSGYELPETSADIFEVAEGITLKDEDVEARIRENASVFDLTDEEMIVFLAVVAKYRKKEITNVYSELPDKVRKMIANLAAEEGISFTEYNKIARLFLDEFISGAELDEAFVDFERSLDEALKMPTIADMYSEHTKMVMDEKIPDIVEKVKDEDPERAELLEEIRNRFYYAYSLEGLKTHFEETARTRKLMRRDYKDPIRFCDEFNLKNDRSKFKMPDCRSISPALARVFLQEEHDEDSRIYKMNINDVDISKFIILFCRSCMNMDPSNILDAAYMYYALKNITMLNLTNETKTDFAVELINNICDIIEFIREKEAEFDASGNSVKYKRK